MHSKALPWQTKGLTLALATNVDSDMLCMLTSERAETLDALGQPPDELQLRAEELVDREGQAEQARVDAFYRDQSARAVPPQRASVGLAWFPAQEYQRALETWPSFAEDYEHGPYDAYCARLELLLRQLKAQGVARLALVPITIDSSKRPRRIPGHQSATSPAGAEANASTRNAAYAPADTTHRPAPPSPNDPETPKLEY
jgi:hypothetical protein